MPGTGVGSLRTYKQLCNFLGSLKVLHFDIFTHFGRGRKSLKNQPRDVIKMREMSGEVVKKTPKKEMDNPLFL